MRRRDFINVIAGSAAARTIVFVLVASVMLSWVALYNHTPLVFSDTIAYATAPLRGENPGFVSPYYGLLILPLHYGITLWPVVFAQGAMLGHLLQLVIRCVSDGNIENFFYKSLLVIAGLCLFSSLPWITGEILPDVFTPVVMLGIFLQAFCSNQLKRCESWYIAILTAIGIAVHVSHIPIAVGLIVLVFVLQRKFAPAQVRFSRLLLLVLPLFIAVGSMLAVNWYHSRALSLAKNGSVFLLAKWIDEGPALSYLEQSCRTVKYELCAYLGDMKGLTHDDLKWGEGSPFRNVGRSFDDLEPEARRIVWGTFKMYPAEILYRSLHDAGRQILRFQTGDGLTSIYARLVAPSLGAAFGPAVETAVLESRQGRGGLPIAEFRVLNTMGVIFGLGLCLWSLFAWRKEQPTRLIILQLFVVAGVVFNAIVTGALSGPYDRYLARVIWLILFVGLVSIWCITRVRSARRC
ncbi:MAG TPA: hypothetical protein VHT68_10985 [Pseudolabrys sp.]|jgi:hypothetical protein|nr:hypothetical protein [Pseudolabrys sp.]